MCIRDRDIDIETGVPTIQKYIVVHDCGNMINPTIVEGQVLGGTAQGIGGAFYEKLVFNEQGQLLTTTFVDYLIPTAMEIPEIEIHHLDRPSIRNPLGVKGVGAGGAILDRLPATLYLAGVSLALAVFIGVPLGIIGAVKRDTLFDQGSKILALLGQSMPNFWLGLMMMWIFSVKLGWLPAGELGGWKHIIMPAITLGSFQIAAITRLVRSAMLETLDTEYVKLVRIKGVKESKVVWVHCLRNAAPTPLTYFGMFAAVLMTGSVTTETIFSSRSG